MKITYLTYQSFPSEKANTLQTISNLKHIVRQGVIVDLIFPKREERSNGSLKKIQEHYQFEDHINLRLEKHPFPFGRIKILEKFIFIVSHFLWAKYIVNKLNREKYQTEAYITRSEWIFYFLSRKDRNVTYECHQSSKIKKIIIPISLKKNNSKVIFLNKNLEKKILKNSLNLNKTIVLHNGVDEDYFKKNIKKNKNEIIFVGNLRRFSKNRNLEFLINSFEKEYILSTYKLKIIGGSQEEKKSLDKLIRNKDLQNKVEVISYLNRQQTTYEIQKSSIGILINSNDNDHSVYFTSPLKYFEYLRGGLKVMAVDFPAHRELPFNELITFFEENNIDDFEKSLKNLSFSKIMNSVDFNKISLQSRASRIIDFVARLEGVEPPTL